MRFFTIALLPLVYASTVDIPAWESSIQSLAAALQTAQGAARSSLLSQFNSLGAIPGVVASDPPSAVTPTVPDTTTPTEPYASYHSWESAMLSIAQSVATATGTNRANLLSQYSALQATPGVIPAVESSTTPFSVTGLPTETGGTSVTTDNSLETSNLSDAGTSDRSDLSTRASRSSSTPLNTASSSASKGETTSSSTSKVGAAGVFPAAGGIASFMLGLVAML